MGSSPPFSLASGFSKRVDASLESTCVEMSDKILPQKLQHSAAAHRCQLLRTINVDQNNALHIALQSLADSLVQSIAVHRPSAVEKRPLERPFEH